MSFQNLLLETVGCRLEFRGIRENCRQRPALDVLRAWIKPIPSHAAQGIQVRRIALYDLSVVRHPPLYHAEQRPEILALQGHLRLALLHQLLRLGLRRNLENDTCTNDACGHGCHRTQLHSFLLIAGSSLRRTTPSFPVFRKPEEDGERPLLPETVEAHPELHFIADRGRQSELHAEVRALEGAAGISAALIALALRAGVGPATPPLDLEGHRLGDAELRREAERQPQTRHVAVTDGDTPAAIVYTSGTTGASKGAVLSHNVFAVNALNLLERGGEMFSFGQFHLGAVFSHPWDNRNPGRNRSRDKRGSIATPTATPIRPSGS